MEGVTAGGAGAGVGDTHAVFGPLLPPPAAKGGGMHGVGLGPVPDDESLGACVRADKALDGLGRD